MISVFTKKNLCKQTVYMYCGSYFNLTDTGLVTYKIIDFVINYYNQTTEHKGDSFMIYHRILLFLTMACHEGQGHTHDF